MHRERGSASATTRKGALEKHATAQQSRCPACSASPTLLKAGLISLPAGALKGCQGFGIVGFFAGCLFRLHKIPACCPASVTPSRYSFTLYPGVFHNSVPNILRAGQNFRSISR